MSSRGQVESEERGKSRRIGVLSELWPFLRPYRRLIAGALVALVATAAISLVLPVVVRQVVDGFQASALAILDQYFFAALAVAVALALGTGLRYYLVTWLGERVVADIREAVFARVIGLSPAFYERIMTGEVLSRITTDTTLILSVIGSSVSVALRNALILLGGVAMMLFTSAKLTGLVLLLVPVVIVPIVVLGRRLREPARRAFRDVTERAFLSAKKRIATRAVMTVIVISLVFSGIVGVLWVGAHDVRAGNMSVGALVQFLIYAVMTAGAVGALSEIWSELQRAAGATERLVELLTAEDSVKEAARPVALPGRVAGAIGFEDVSFRYPSRPEHLALDGVSLDVKPGETVALVGPSGAGKSTMIQLLQRFYDPNEGAVTIDGVALTGLARTAFRRQIALVPQDAVIFATTARENIRFGRPEATDAEVEAAAKAAAADDFLRKLPGGYDTFVGERGFMLSGGQKQRIAIARAILRDAPILLLDEATSALDAESERLVQQAVDEMAKGRTTLIIAHRLATVKKADRIVVFDEGRIVAQGTHAELVEEGGLYARLARLQFTDGAVPA